jgi:hypothetical protein
MSMMMTRLMLLATMMKMMMMRRRRWRRPRITPSRTQLTMLTRVTAWSCLGRQWRRTRA